jgi:hypothetical protein
MPTKEKGRLARKNSLFENRLIKARFPLGVIFRAEFLFVFSN